MVMRKFPPTVSIIIAYTALCATLAFVSITITGFKFGVGSNGFHIPYVLNLAESQEFTDDAYYSSLKHYTSIIWPILGLITNESNVENVFYVANFLTRVAFFAGLVFLIRANGFRSISSTMICLMVIALTPWLQGYSIVGAHRTFINHFTHTETTWVLVFVSLALFSQYRVTSASAMTGAIFSINAFVSIWLFLANTFSLLYSRKRIDSVTAIKSIGAFVLFASPTLIWMMSAVDSEGTVTNFRYINYIRQLYPNHFLIEAISWKSLAIFAMIFVNGVLATQYTLNKQYWIGLQSGFILIFLVGIPLPYLFDNRLVFNLHLLRSAGVEQTIAVVLCAMAGTRLIVNADSFRSQLLGVTVLVCMATFDLSISTLSLVALALFVGCFDRQHSAFDNSSILLRLAEHPATVLFSFWLTIVGFLLSLTRQLMLQPIGLAVPFLLIFLISAFSIFLLQRLSAGTKLNLFVLVLAFCAIGTMAKAIDGRAEDATIREQVMSRNGSWIELLDWIRNSSLHGVFLIPVKEKHSEDELTAGYGFQLYARRKVWVDWEQGAAVMWAPSFYDQWMRRFSEVSALKTPDDFIFYAHNHAIHNIVLKSDAGGCPVPSRFVKSTQHFILCVI